jgi:tetratricopeptide (TPR) repeat protein
LLLSRNEFEAAVEIYDRIYTEHDLEFSERYRELLLDHASHLNQDGQLAAATDLLAAYLSLYHADVEALILQARVYRNDGEHLLAIRSLQQAGFNEHRHGVARLIQNQANIVIGAYAQGLRDRNDKQAVTELYQWLTRSQPTVAGYHIGLARAYADQQRFGEAVNALRYVQHDAALGDKARTLMDRYTTQKSRG